ALELAWRGHEVAVLHRGEHPGDGLPDRIAKIPCDRSNVKSIANALETARADALVDTRAMTKADAEKVLEAAHSELRLVVLSSMDVYRAYGSLLAGRVTDAVPIDESGPLREERFVYRDLDPDRQTYEKLDVEELFLARGATVCRLAAVYGEN